METIYQKFIKNLSKIPLDTSTVSATEDLKPILDIVYSFEKKEIKKGYVILFDLFYSFIEEKKYLKRPEGEVVDFLLAVSEIPTLDESFHSWVLDFMVAFEWKNNIEEDKLKNLIDTLLEIKNRLVI